MERILLVGKDPALLETRSAVLSKTGAETLCYSPGQALLMPPALAIVLVIVCHSVEGDDRTKCVEAARRNWPRAKILQLQSHFGEAVASGADAGSETRPGKLLLKALEMLTESRADHDAHRDGASFTR